MEKTRYRRPVDNGSPRSSRWGQHYVPRYLCSPVPMFPDPMFPGTDVPRYLCSPVPMFPKPMFPGTYVPRYRCSPNLCSPVPMFPDLLQMSYVSTLPLSGVNSRFFAPSRFPDFHLKCPAFLRVSSWKKCTLCALLRRLGGVGNQLPMLGKGNSFGKFIKLCVFCLFVYYDFVLAA